jgi:hypothetical protein
MNSNDIALQQTLITETNPVFITSLKQREAPHQYLLEMRKSNKKFNHQYDQQLLKQLMKMDKQQFSPREFDVYQVGNIFAPKTSNQVLNFISEQSEKTP